MYTDHYGMQEYPFVATFYYLGVDENKPLDQQVEEEVAVFQTRCDITDDDKTLNDDILAVFFPLNPNAEAIGDIIGKKVKVETYGILQKARVLGVFPSQIGGVKVICKRI